MAEVEQQHFDNPDSCEADNAISPTGHDSKFPKGALGADMANPAFETISLHYLDLSTWEDVKEGINQNTAPSKGAAVPVGAVRLFNNNLDNWSGLEMGLSMHIPNPFKNLRWLDMAFNKITKINGELLQLEALQILDLRANQISNIWEVPKLQKLSKLHKLNLNGNPFQAKNEKCYRKFIIGAMLKPDPETGESYTHLVDLDVNLITKDERADGIGVFLAKEEGRRIAKDKAEEARLMADARG